MAVSPLPLYNASPRSNKTKPLTHRPNPKGSSADAASTPNPKSKASIDGVLDLAERLNAETKSQYIKGKWLGKGTYANVYEAHLKSNPSQLFAIKKMIVGAEAKDGLSMDSIREVKYLQELSHPNIIKLHAVFSSKNQNLNLVLEHLPRGSLEQLISEGDIQYGSADIKAWMGMLARGLHHCHSNFILHRDIKPGNVLVAADGELKLADFGLARSFADPWTRMTYLVITRWYRPPELLFQARHYGSTADVWSVGVIFAELVIRKAWMPGGSDLEQLHLIANVVGLPTEDVWPGVSKLDGYIKLTKDPAAPQTPVQHRQQMQREFALVGPEGVDLLMQMMALDPRKRATAKKVLMHEWWNMEPKPRRKEDLPRKVEKSKEGMADALKRKPGELEGGTGRGDKVARKIDFGAFGR
ncbi:serine/threonine-protein kinase crk1 [Patellaria atrata CBS 101060]|uniref:Serine/threonine-protein kinase crk1 n=1 Tax=Patellaria atrata CBS 101060 TaxID=1346257 RepID=A0A9P4SH71_9PEZI|nr:serine/threonine-protein kinase crk1 [Patellaria atrata CBS 101060]